MTEKEWKERSNVPAHTGKQKLGGTRRHLLDFAGLPVHKWKK